MRSAGVLGVEIDSDGAYAIALRSRGTPRIANRLLKRVRDFAEVMGDGKITKEMADIALNRLEIDKLGLELINEDDINFITSHLQEFTHDNRSGIPGTRRRPGQANRTCSRRATCRTAARYTGRDARSPNRSRAC